MCFAAAIQMVSSDNIQQNLMQAEMLINNAVNKGASFILLPENFAFMGSDTASALPVAEVYGDGFIQNTISQLANKHKVTIVAGTIPILANDYLETESHKEKVKKINAASIIYGPDGKVIARYDKQHLFDVYLDGGQETYRESDTYSAGNDTVTVQTAIGKVGMSICYDIRFPEMFRQMHDKGVQIILTPSAFTEQTGRVHWEPLLRARAIENLCYVIAANQGGIHANGRKTFGNSMIIDPWGRIISRIQNGAGVIISEINLDLQKHIREDFPALEHRKG